MPTTSNPPNQFDLKKINSMAPPAGVSPPTKQSKPWGQKPGIFTFYTLTTAPSNPTLKAPADKPSFYIKKFNADLELESQYVMNFIPSTGGGYYDCTCPGAAKRFDCRHKAIMREITGQGKQDSGEFFCFETRVFKKPEEIGK